jgi:hypothetical protein
MREPRLPPLLILGADVVPEVHGYDGRFMVLVHDQGEPIIEHELLIGNVDVLGLG